MKIVVLDGHALNPGDLSWSALEALGELTVYDRTPSAAAAQRAAGAEIVLTNKTPLRAETLEQLPELRYIGVLATGYDVVDVQAAAEQGVAVTNVPDYGTDSVAQYVIALLLELCSGVGVHSASVRAGDWSGGEDWCYWRTPLRELTGKTMGIIGLGRIGLRTAQLAQALGMRVIATTRRMDREAPPGIVWRTQDQLLQEADAISLHCPLTPQTEGLIGREALRMMKHEALLINTARGGLVDAQALAAALHAGTIGGAALDVLAPEPPHPDNPLLRAPRCIVTPHVAWASLEARGRLLDTAVRNVRAFLDGTPANRVDGVKG
ncbi:D-2-hydroxyacid dehydrogenase [Paenibacillus sp. IB182496]|uniref:D-2-hydroxyacid dehydrogenase n=1 Tax=Paenibacillus sabuli TaxID=2772509 RepID=A0A927BRY5_9BACL|nr:D-2-hydroxyacid dehydrogenase [Paenibacillus sabuli]MBD2844806.1 D-2-hydroxyacid dehydrogenase [Paenibacillus sabuli]